MKYFHLHEFIPYIDCALLNSETIKTNQQYKFIGLTLENDIKDISTQLYNSKIIYIHPDSYDTWTDILLMLHQENELPIKVIIMSGSDYFIDNEILEPLVECFSNTKFLIQNWLGKHERVSLLPIGINEDFLDHILKEKKFGISFANNNGALRKEFNDYLDITPSVKEFLFSQLPRGDFLKELSKCYYTALTIGNGFDTLRFWESLMVKTVPIVKKNVFYENLIAHYPTIPMIMVDDWNELEQLLETLDLERYNKLFDGVDLTYIESEYWLNKIHTIIG